MTMVIDGKRAVLYAGAARKDGHFYPSIVLEDTAGYQTTDWDWGTDGALFEQLVAQYNTTHGYSTEEVDAVIASSMRAQRAEDEARPARYKAYGKIINKQLPMAIHEIQQLFSSATREQAKSDLQHALAALDTARKYAGAAYTEELPRFNAVQPRETERAP